jgi:hypothetical protein
MKRSIVGNNNAITKKVKRSFGSGVIGASGSLRNTKSKAKKG